MRNRHFTGGFRGSKLEVGGGAVELGGHGGGDGGDVPVTQGSALDIHAFRRHNLHNLHIVKTMHLTCSGSSNISNLHFAWVSPLQSHLQLSSVHREGAGAGVGLGVGKADVQLR